MIVCLLGAAAGTGGGGNGMLEAPTPKTVFLLVSAVGRGVVDGGATADGGPSSIDRGGSLLGADVGGAAAFCGATGAAVGGGGASGMLVPVAGNGARAMASAAGAAADVGAGAGIGAAGVGADTESPSNEASAIPSLGAEAGFAGSRALATGALVTSSREESAISLLLAVSTGVSSLGISCEVAGSALTIN